MIVNWNDFCKAGLRCLLQLLPVLLTLAIFPDYSECSSAPINCQTQGAHGLDIVPDVLVWNGGVVVERT